MLQDKLSGFRLILASQSPRRQMLLKGLDINFEVITTPQIDETFPDNIFEKDIAIYLSKRKAQAYQNLLDAKTIVITADTIVWFKNQVLNKPANRNEAINMLKMLSGQVHTVFTGICISTINRSKTFCSETKVWFSNLRDIEIIFYVDKYKPYDKAGAYGAQEWLGYVAIERIEGSYFNVMGLPVQQLYNELKNFI